jgi:3',5'-cyclic AMP phosphodiesterase CpdA
MAVKIVLVTDTHLSPRALAFNANWEVARRWIAGQEADAVIHLGDITADGVADMGEMEFAAIRFTGMAPRFVPGNHDIGDPPVVPGRISEHPLDAERLAQYHEVFGAGCWWFRTDGWRCIGLNAQLFGSGGRSEEEQFNWLSRLVVESSERLALFLHKPLFRDGWDDGQVHARYVPPAARARLKTILPLDRLGLVASGHTHQARRLEQGGTTHIWVPSTSFCIPDAVQEKIGEKVVGLVVLELDGERFSATFVEPDGMIRHNLMEYEAVYPQLRNLDPSLRSARL